MSTCTRAVQVGDITKGFIRENPGLFIWYLVFLAVVPLTDVGIPHMVGRVIKNLNSKRQLYFNFIIIVVFIALGQIGHTISDTIDVYMLPNMVDYVRNLIVKHILDVQSTQYSELKGGEISTKLIKLPVTYYGFAEQIKNLWIPEFIILLVSVIYLIRVDPPLGYICLILTIAIIIYSFKTITFCEMISRKRDASFNATVEETDDILRNSISVINANQQEQELQRLKDKHKIYDKMSKETFQCGLRPRYVYLPIIILLFTVYMVYSYQKIKDNTLKIASFVVILLIVVQVVTSMFKILGSIKDTVFKWGMLQYSMEIFNKCQVEKFQNLRENVPKEGIFVDNITYQYKSEDGTREVFKDFSLYIKPNKCTIVEGKIGSGKSTLIKLLNKYHLPDNGSIFINGMPYTALSPQDLHRIIGYVPQTPTLFNRSIYDNITYGIEPKPSESEVENWLKSLSVYELVDELPKGLQTNAGKNGSNISGGQRQIVWFLRIILQNTPYIILDEPTSAMDGKTKMYIYKLIEKLKKDKTIVVVSHDTKIRNYADEVIRL